MATPEECEQALRDAIGRMGEVDPEIRQRYDVERSVSCRCPDVGTTWCGLLQGGRIRDLTRYDDTDGTRGNAQIRLVVSSDDLVALTAGRLPVLTAWASGRLTVEAGVRDMLRLRSLF